MGYKSKWHKVRKYWTISRWLANSLRFNVFGPLPAGEIEGKQRMLRQIRSNLLLLVLVEDSGLGSG